MAYLRESRISRRIKQALSSVEDVQDQYLAEEDEAFDNLTSKSTLSIEIESSQGASSSHSNSDTSTFSLKGDNQEAGTVTFEVIRAEKVTEGRSSFVKYTISIGDGQNSDRVPGIVEKRYSDFSCLNSKLHKKFPQDMENVSFPGKVVIGNFTDETIAQRSRAFEQYLTHLFSIDCIRFSSEFQNFFYQESVQEAVDCLRRQEYEKCATSLEQSLPIQEQLLGNNHSHLVCTLCTLSLCYQKIEKREVALKYAEYAFSCVQNNKESVFFIPLIRHYIYLCWLLGKEKSHLEAKCAEVNVTGVKQDELAIVVSNYSRFDSVWYDD